MLQGYVKIPPLPLIVLIFFSNCRLFAQPSASFSSNNTSGCNPLKVDYKNHSKNAVSYLWTLGNGNQSTLENPSAVYNNPGKYTVKLVAYDASGNSDTFEIVDYITVFASPQALFKKTQNVICQGDSVSFEDLSVEGDASITDWKWDFGDGGTSGNRNPVYRYTLAGKYDVTLAVTDANGCQSTLKSVKFAEIKKLPNVSFTSNDNRKCNVPASVNFTATGTGASPFTYLWKFSNGGTSTAANPMQTFKSLGTYDVVLIMKDANGCVDSITSKNFVKIITPSIDFKASSTTVCPGEMIQFTNINYPNDGRGSFIWSFSNGATTTDSNPQLSFAKAGRYKVHLYYSWDGCSVSKTKDNYITVLDAPDLYISPKNITVCKSDADSLEITPTGSNISEIGWFTNGPQLGRTFDLNKLKFPLNKTGVYHLTAFPRSSKGCSGPSDTAYIRVVGPEAKITASPVNGCIPFTGNAVFSGSSASPIVKYEWSGLSGIPNGNAFDYSKTTFGKSVIVLKVTDASGCTDTALIEIEGGIKVDPDFKVPPKVCRNEKFWVFNYSAVRNPDSVQFKYTWNGGSPLDLDIIDSAKKALLDSPNTEGIWSFEAHSFGCITKGSQRPKTRILGPKLDGTVRAICNKDSITGINKSSDYTRTFWRYLDENSQLVFDPVKNISRGLSSTKDLWLFAFNDTNQCSDSLPYQTSTNPRSVKITWEYNCNGQMLKASHDYSGVPDSVYQWNVVNTTTGNIMSVRSKNLQIHLSESGAYEVDLKILNAPYGCTPSNGVSFYVKPRPSGRPSVSLDRNSCYPVKVSLNDPTFNKGWKNAIWTVDDLKLKDSSAKLEFQFTGTSDTLPVYLLRVDSTGCESYDTFNFNVQGFKAGILTGVAGDLCTETTIFYSSVIQKDGSAPYAYKWDFGYRTGNKSSDTARVKGSREIPVTLWVTDQKGCESRESIVSHGKSGKPKAAFSVSDTAAACPPLDVVFTDLTNSPEYPIVKRLWSFGDSTFSNKEKPGKLYIYPGRYSVSLIVTNSVGCSDTALIPNLVVVNGPYGSYQFDRKEGCTPLDLKLTTELHGKIKELQFDMGDGYVLDLGENNHRYSLPGKYVPRLIVVDSNGCRFSPDPVDTIWVHPNPEANFSGANVCDNQVYHINPNSDMKGDSLAGVRWYKEGKYAGNQRPLRIGFKGYKTLDIGLVVTSNYGCTDSVSRRFNVFTRTPSAKADKEEYCLGEAAFVVHTSTGDTSIVSTKLFLDGVLMPDGDRVQLPAARRGRIPALLCITDALGCMDTADFPVFIKVGDTLPTPPLTMYRTSVVDNFTTETRFSVSQEPDFKSYRLYVWQGNAWALKAESENLNDTNLFVAGLNTLKQSYCHRISQVNFCGMETDSTVIQPHCSVEIQAKGDINRALVTWNPYGGWPVLKYRIWRKTDQENTFTLLDSVPGNQLLYYDTSIYCHVVYDYKVEAFEKGGHFEFSWSDTARAKPLHSLKVPAPEVWRTTVNDNLYTHTEWITPLKPKFGIDHFTVYKLQDFGWEPYRDNISKDSLSIDDKDVRVNSSYYTYAVKMTDKCGVESDFSNVGRSILLKVNNGNPDGKAELSWSRYIYWNEGVQEYQVERSIGGSNFEQIGKVDGETLQFEDDGLPKHCEKDFIYRVIAIRNQPQAKDSSHFAQSVSNYAAYTPVMRFFIPNAYTPNKNNLNESFRPDGIYFYKYDMQIYNRYGQKLYDRDDCLNAWDGTYNGEQAPDGVYAYYIKAWDLFGVEYQFSGTIHLLR